MLFSLLGIKYDKTQTLFKGAAKAPLLLRKAFPKMETFVNGVDLTEHFIKDVGDIAPRTREQLIFQTSRELSRMKGFPIILGGEHSISEACVSLLKPKTFLSLDAHPDLEAGEKHNGVARRIFQDGIDIKLYGIRCVSKTEDSYMRKHKIIVSNFRELKRVKGPVYLSIDYDVFDPSIIRSVGNPEPDGLTFEQILEAIKTVAPKLIAADFVEFTPMKDRVDSIIAAKLIYATLAEIIKSRKY